MLESERTIKELFRLWFWNFQNASLQQYSNIYLATVAILTYYNIENRYKAELEAISTLFFNPCPTLKEKYPSLPLKGTTVDWDIPKIEWCYFRDTHFKVKLGREYMLDARKLQETKKMVLGEMITILSLFKNEMFQRIIRIMIDNKIVISISLPSEMKEVQPLSEEGMA